MYLTRDNNPRIRFSIGMFHHLLLLFISEGGTQYHDNRSVAFRNKKDLGKFEFMLAILLVFFTDSCNFEVSLMFIGQFATLSRSNKSEVSKFMLVLLGIIRRHFIAFLCQKHN